MARSLRTSFAADGFKVLAVVPRPATPACAPIRSDSLVRHSLLADGTAPVLLFHVKPTRWLGPYTAAFRKSFVRRGRLTWILHKRKETRIVPGPLSNEYVLRA